MHRIPPADVNRHILCIYPRFPSSLARFDHAYRFMDGMRALMPPHGLLVVAAVLPANWQVRLVDENIRTATREDYLWADAVFVSGMHAQRQEIKSLCRRAHSFDRTVVLGGPSVSASPEHYPECDYLHVGELGDATDELIARLGQDPSRPTAQVVLTTEKRRDLIDFPLPAYELVESDRYAVVGGLQYSVGCPYQCEFCDIPALYGRVPRLKKPEQITAELDKLIACGAKTAGFIDDNFIGNRRATRELLLVLVEWQRSRGYPFQFSCEATINLAKYPDMLTLMREARFVSVYCGIETPEPVALKAMAKAHNLMLPIIESVRTLNRYGLEVSSGIILGLDTDTPSTGKRIIEFIEASHIPLLFINLVTALPRTPLWDRLERDGRLLHDEQRESNVDFIMPYRQVLAIFRDTVIHAFASAAVFERYAHQLLHTYPNRLAIPSNSAEIDWPMLKRGLRVLCSVMWACGVRASYRFYFWRVALRCLRKGWIAEMISIAFVADNMIHLGVEAEFGRSADGWHRGRGRV